MKCNSCHHKMTQETLPPLCDECMASVDKQLAKMATEIQRSVMACHWDNPVLSADRLREFIELAKMTKMKIIELTAMNIVRSYLMKKWSETEVHRTDGEFWLAIDLEDRIKRRSDGVDSEGM
jgi:hypothetical protein